MTPTSLSGNRSLLSEVRDETREANRNILRELTL